MSTLTDDYVDAVIRHLPENRRREIGADVSAVIAEMIDARLAATTPKGDSATETTPASDAATAQAERAVLEELGNPAHLARQYSDLPVHLIGPQLYPVYVRALQWLLPLVGVLALLTNGIVHSLTVSDPRIGGIIGPALGNTVIALLVAFAALTIGLAVLGRTMPTTSIRGLTGSGAWSVDQLAAARTGYRSPVRVEAALGLVMLALLALVPVLPTTLFYIGHLNNDETFLNPGLGFGWIAGYWVGLALIAVPEVWKIVRNRLTTASTVVSIVVDVMMAVFLTVAVLAQPVLHPDLAPGGLPMGGWLVVLGIWVITIWDQVSTIRAHRAS